MNHFQKSWSVVLKTLVHYSSVSSRLHHSGGIDLAEEDVELRVRSASHTEGAHRSTEGAERAGLRRVGVSLPAENF